MGASCTTMKIVKVIRPVRHTGEESTQPESLNSEEKRNGGSDKKASGKSRKESNDTSLHVATTTNVNSRKNLGSTTEGLEDTLRQTTLNGFTGDNWNNTSNMCDDSIAKKSAHYKKGPLIGKGSSGEVYECLNLNTGELVAIKEIKLYGDIEKMQPTITALLKENVQFRMLGHQNIIRYYETEILEAKDQSHLLIDIALEYVSGGSIKVLVDKFNNLEEKVVSSYTRQILEGLCYLHRNNIVHRNLKATNILIDASGTIKLSDFGTLRFDRFSEENPQENNKNSPSKSPLYWLAPEVVMKKALGKPADIWSVGCVALEMLTGSPPWKGLAKNNDELTKLITSGAHPNFPVEISEVCRDFLMKTLKFKPEDRPTALDLLEHPFVRDLMSPNNSYLEADTIQSSVVGRPNEYLRNNSNQFFNFKNSDVRVQNFVSSTSNLNVSRMISRGVSGEALANGILRLGSTEVIPLTRSEIQENNKENEPPKSSGNLIKVQEVSCEDEYTPSTTDRQFFPTRPRHVWEQKALSFEEKDKEKTEEQDLEKIKAEKRRQLEEEMMRELNQAADQINEVEDEDEDNENSRDESPTKPVVENYSNAQGSQMLNINSRLHVPVKNPLFTGISFSDFKRSGSHDSSHPEGLIEASPMANEDEIAEKFNNIRPDDLGVYWTWEGDNEKEENEIETAKEVKSEKLQESEGNSEMGDGEDNHVAHIENQYDDMWTPEFKENNNEKATKNSNRLIKSDLERFRRAQKKLAERGHTQELEEIDDDKENRKPKNNNEAQMLEVGEGEGTIYYKQTSLRYESDLPYSDEIQSRGMRSIEGSQIIMRTVKETEAVIEASPGFKDLEGDDYASNGDIEA